MNSPVLGSNPTCTVCSKSIGEEISGLSFPRDRREREGGREGEYMDTKGMRFYQYTISL